VTDSDEPEAYRTLRGFLSGDEPDEATYFCFSATLRIHGVGLPFDEIAQQLGVQPTHVHRKGERRGPRSPGYRDDAWHFQPPVPETEPLARHIEALWDVRAAGSRVSQSVETTLRGQRVLWLSFELRHGGLRGAAHVPRVVYGAGGAVWHIRRHCLIGLAEHLTPANHSNE
jgi:hypothetical protein